MTVHSFFLSLLSFTYINIVTHGAFYFVYYTSMLAFNFVDTFSKDLMDRKCNCYLPSKVNGKYVYEGKGPHRCIIYEVKCSMCDDIYIGNTQQNYKKRMDGHLSDILRILKNGKNLTHLLPILNSVLTLLYHRHIYVSI